MKKVLSFLILFLTLTVLGTSAQKSRENYYLLGPQSCRQSASGMDFFNTALKLEPVKGSNSKYYIDIPAQYPYDNGGFDIENGQIADGSNIYNAFLNFGVYCDQNGTKQDFLRKTISVDGKSSKSLTLHQLYMVNSPVKKDKEGFDYENFLNCVRLFEDGYKSWQWSDKSEFDGSYQKEFNKDGFWDKIKLAANFKKLRQTYTNEFIDKFVAERDRLIKQTENELKDKFISEFHNYFKNPGFSFYLAKESTILSMHNGSGNKTETALSELLVPAGALQNDNKFWIYGKKRKSGRLTNYTGKNTEDGRWEIRFGDIYTNKDIRKNLEVVDKIVSPDGSHQQYGVVCRLTEAARDKLLLDGSYRFTIDVATGTWSVEYQEKRVAYMMAFTEQWGKWHVEGTYTMYDTKNQKGAGYGGYQNKYVSPYTYIFKEADADGNKYSYDFMQNNIHNNTTQSNHLPNILREAGKLIGNDVTDDYNLSDYAPQIPSMSVPYLVSFGPGSNGGGDKMNFSQSGLYKGTIYCEPGFKNNVGGWPQGGYVNVAQYSYSIADHGHITVNDGKDADAHSKLQSIYLCNGGRENGALNTKEPVKLTYKTSKKAYVTEISSKDFHNGTFYFIGFDDVVNSLDSKLHDYVFTKSGEQSDYPTATKPNNQNYRLRSSLEKLLSDGADFANTLFYEKNVAPDRLNTFKDPDDSYNGYYRISVYITSEEDAHYTIEKIGNMYKGVALLSPFTKCQRKSGYDINDPSLSGEEMTYVNDGIPHYELRVKAGAYNKYWGEPFCFEVLKDDGKKLLYGKYNSSNDIIDRMRDIVRELQGYNNYSLDNYKNCQARTDDFKDHIAINDSKVSTLDGPYLSNLNMGGKDCDLIFRFYPVYGNYAFYTITPLINEVSLLVDGAKKIYSLTPHEGDSKLAQNTFDYKDEKDKTKDGIISSDILKPGTKFIFNATLNLLNYKTIEVGQNESSSPYTFSNGAYNFLVSEDKNVVGVVPDVPNGVKISGYKIKNFIVMINPSDNKYFASYQLIPVLESGQIADDVDGNGYTVIDFSNNSTVNEATDRDDDINTSYIRTYSNPAYSYDLNNEKNRNLIKAYIVTKVNKSDENIDGTANLKVTLTEVTKIKAKQGVILVPFNRTVADNGNADEFSVKLKPEDCKDDGFYDKNYLQPSNEGTYVNFEETDNDGDVVARNYFLSTWHKTVDYPEYGGDDYVGFFRAISSELGRYKAYLSLSADLEEFNFNGRQLGGYNLGFEEATGQNSKAAKFGVMLVFDDIDDDSNTTGISGIKAASMNDDAYYSLSGERTTTPHAGKMYIHGGKKVVIVK